MNFFGKKKEKSAGFSQKVHAFKEKPRLQYLLPWRNIDPAGIVYGKNNDFLAVFSFRGPDMESSTPEELVMYNAALNNVMKSLPTGYSLYFEVQRHFAGGYERSEFPAAILNEMEKERADYYDSHTHFVSDYYFTVCYEPPQLIKSKITSAFIDDAKNKHANKEKDLKIFKDNVNSFYDTFERIGEMLSHVFINIQPLTSEETLTYLHSTISNKHFKVKFNLLHQFICDYIVDESVTAGREPKLGDKHMRIITILNFPPVSTPGIFDSLNKLNFEYRWVSRFVCMSKQDAQKEIKEYQTMWGQQIISPWDMVRRAITREKTEIDPDETAFMNKDDSTMALAELSEDLVGYGYYTMTAIVTDEDEVKANDKASKILETINSLGFVGYIEKDNAMEAWWGSLPGCFRANIRRPIISSLNFCHLAPATATWPGDKRNNHLKGPMWLCVDTDGSTPFFLNPYVGDVGHTMVVGPSGTGKSVLLNTMEAHFLKYKNAKVFIFDKAASSRATTLAVGGSFYNLAAEGTGELSFQPLAQVDDDNEIKWAKEWILAYLRQQNMTVTPIHDNYVWKALKSLATFPPEQRTISNFCDLVQDQEIRITLKPMTSQGSYGKLFDNNKETAGTDGFWQVYEMETLMATPAIVPATLDYLFHRIESSLKAASGPAIIVLDECWLFFDNPAFKDKLREYFKDMRKKNTAIIFATQQLADVANKPDLLTTIMENCPTRIYLPNVNAINTQNREFYKTFGCNEQQITLIAQMMPKQYYYFSNPEGNRIFSLALQPRELPFFTATSKTDQMAMDQILASGIHSGDEFAKKWIEYKRK